MFDVAISQLTTARWELPQELAQIAEHGFAAVSLWRPKLSDVGIRTAATQLAGHGLRVSSLQWAGGFTGSDGRSYNESVADAVEAIEAAARLAAACPRADRPPVLLVLSGCRGGHTRSHAGRLLAQALDVLAPVARREGVVLALKPFHPLAAPGCSFMTDIGEALDLVERFGDDTIRLAVDLWHFAQTAGLAGLLPRLAAVAGVVQVADRCGPPSSDADRQPAGYGGLDLESLVASLWEHGYRGDFEFDPVGETVEMLGYSGVLQETRRVADAWAERLSGREAVAGHRFEGSCLQARGVAAGISHAPAEDRLRDHLRRSAGAAGSRRSQASSHSVSRG